MHSFNCQTEHERFGKWLEENDIRIHHLMFPANEARGFKWKVESKKSEYLELGVPEEVGEKTKS